MFKIAAIVILIMLPCLHAQEPEKQPRSGILIRAFAFGHFKGIDVLELRREERKLGNLELPTGQLRQGVTVPARQFAYGVAKDNDGFNSMGNVELPKAGRDFILVFAPEENGYRVFVVRADDPDFRGNDTHLFNFTERHLGVLLGEARTTVKPLENTRLRPSFPADATFYQALFAYEKDGKFIPFNNTRWPVNPNTKALLFVYEDEASGQFSYRAVVELAR